MHNGESTVQVLGGRGLSHWDEPGLGPGARDVKENGLHSD